MVDYYNMFDAKNNPFLDAKQNPFFDPAKNPFLNNDFASSMSSFKSPNMDISEVFASQKKTFEAIAAANKTAVEGMQAVFKRQSEIVKSIMDEAATAAKSIDPKAAPEKAAAGQIDAVKGAIEDSVANLRELSEMVAKSQTEAFEILNARLTESLEEVKSTVAKIKK